MSENNEELDTGSYSKEWIEYQKNQKNFGKNGELGPKTLISKDDDCCPHGNHIMSGCAECTEEEMDYAVADSIACDLLGLHGNDKANYSLMWGGGWIVVLIDKGDNDPYIACLKRNPDGKWYRGALKSIESLE